MFSMTRRAVAFFFLSSFSKSKLRTQISDCRYNIKKTKNRTVHCHWFNEFKVQKLLDRFFVLQLMTSIRKEGGGGERVRAILL